MRIEIIVLAALAAFASAAPQWPYRDAVAPYYYGYPGKTPFMYRSGASGDEDDEMDETSYLARQDLKVATPEGGSSVTVVEDDEKADGIRVVETGSAKPVAQTASNNNQLGLQQDQQPAAPAQAQQPLNNANNAQSANNQPLTVQQPGQQPPQAFPPARPTNAAPAKVKEEEDDDEEEDDSEEDDEDGDDEEDDGDDDDDDEDEEDDEERRRNDVQQKDVSAEEPSQQQQQNVQEPQAVQPVQIVQSNSESDEVQEEAQPIEQSPPPSQTAVVNNKINKNKHNAAAAAAANAPGSVKPKKKPVSGNKVSGSKNPTGAIEALVPGYVTDQGEVLVPVDTVTGSQPITIVPDPFSPPSRIVGGPRPIPQSAVPSVPHRQVPYWYRNSPASNPLTQGSPISGQTLYSAVPPPGSIFTFDDDDDDDDIEDSPSIIPGNRLRQDDDDDDDDDDEDEEEDQRVIQNKPPRVPLAAVPASGNSGEDDEAEALAFVNSGKPGGNRRPIATAASGNKKPAGAALAGTKEPASVESSEEDESEEDDIDSGEEDDIARGVTPENRGRMYVDEEYVSFPPSRSPSIFAVVQGRFPVPVSQQRQQSNIYTSAIPGNPFQRYVVRVTPSNRQRPSAGPAPSLYYRPYESNTPNRRVVPVASFDVSVEDTRPSSSALDSDEEGIVVASGGAGPTPVTSYPFVYNVQGALHTRGPNGRPPRPSISYYGGSSSGRPRPIFGPGGGPRPYGRPSFYPGSTSSINPYAALLGQAAGFSFGSSRPPSRISSSSGGPPVIVRRKQSGSGPNRPPKPHLIAVYNPTGSSSSGGPRPREPVEEEYYTFEVPEGNNKFVPGNSGSSSSSHKRPTVHRRPTPVIKQKVAVEESSEEDLVPPSGPVPQGLHIIPQGTVRRRIRGGKQLKPKKNPKKTTSSTKKQQQTEDPLGLLSKINKSTKSKVH